MQESGGQLLLPVHPIRGPEDSVGAATGCGEGASGWRLDVATEVDSHFWREFRQTVHAINPDAVIIGEFWRNAEAWLQGDQFDGVMNYGMQRPAVLYFAKSAISPQQFQGLLTENLMRYTDAANASMLNLLDSHDTARFVTVCGGDTARLKKRGGVPVHLRGHALHLLWDRDRHDWGERPGLPQSL